MISIALKVCLVSIILIILMFIYWNSSRALNISLSLQPHLQQIKHRIPNIVHYILFNNCSINFFMYLSILSAIKVQKPSAILIHSDKEICVNKYWNALQKLESATKIEVVNTSRPTHVYGQPISSVYHASDVTRIRLLQLFGGIYLDNDVLIINNLDPLRSYDIVIGWPEKQFIGNQVILANKHAKFLQLWLEGYKHYHPRNWYYNAGQYPTEIILEKHPELIHREPELLGVHYLLDKLLSREKWLDWKLYYTIHLLSRHSNFMINADETTVQKNTNLADIIHYILNL